VSLVECILKERLVSFSGRRKYTGFEKFNSEFLYVANVEDMKESLNDILKQFDATRKLEKQL